MVINLVNLNIVGACLEPCMEQLHSTDFGESTLLLANAKDESALPSLSGAEMGMGDESGSSAPSSSSSSSSSSQYGSCRSRLVSYDLSLNSIIDFY